MKHITSVCLRKGFAVKLISIILCVSLIFTFSIGAFASSYHYGVFKFSAIAGYDRSNDTYSQSAVGVAVGALTGSYSWGMNEYKPGGSRQAQQAQLRLTYRSYGYTGNDGDFSSDSNSIGSNLVLTPGMVAPALVNGQRKFTQDIVVVLSDDTAKVQVSFTSNIPIDRIALRTSNNGSSVSNTSYEMTKGIDYVVNGDSYLVNCTKSFPNGYYVLWLDIYASPSVTNSGTKWNQDSWRFKLNRSLFPFWLKTSLNGTGTTTNTNTNPSTVTNITYNYSANLDGIYNLLCILCDWENLQFDTEMAMLEELQEAKQLLNQQWSMLMVLDSDLGIIAGDTADILSSMYYSPGVTWFEHLYLRLAECTEYVYRIKNDVGSILTGVGDINTVLNNILGQEWRQNNQIISELQDIEAELQKLNRKLDDIYDWLEDLDLENGSDTKSFIQSVFAWIKQLLVVIVGIFATVITVPTLSVITDYNSDSSSELLPEGVTNE